MLRTLVFLENSSFSFPIFHLSLHLLSDGIIGVYHLYGARDQIQGVCIQGKHSPNGYIFNPISKYLTISLNLSFLDCIQPSVDKYRALGMGFGLSHDLATTVWPVAFFVTFFFVGGGRDLIPDTQSDKKTNGENIS